MQNKCNCCSQGFVPVNGSWDFNHGDCGCQQNDSRRTNRRGNRPCDGCETGYNHKDACQCERCDDNRQAECCAQNTYIRDMEACREESGRSRSGCACDKEETAYARRTNGTCREGCACENCTRARKNRRVGMVNVERQEIDEIYESESALRAGTLFPELHKPLNGYCPYDDSCGSCKQQAAFAAWELRLYLNTHPDDKEALALLRKLSKEAGDVNYATTFLTDACEASGWSWVKNPWPWEYEANCCE